MEGGRVRFQVKKTGTGLLSKQSRIVLEVRTESRTVCVFKERTNKLKYELSWSMFRDVAGKPCTVHCQLRRSKRVLVFHTSDKKQQFLALIRPQVADTVVAPPEGSPLRASAPPLLPPRNVLIQECVLLPAEHVLDVLPLAVGQLAGASSIHRGTLCLTSFRLLLSHNLPDNTARSLSVLSDLQTPLRAILDVTHSKKFADLIVRTKDCRTLSFHFSGAPVHGPEEEEADTPAAKQRKAFAEALMKAAFPPRVVESFASRHFTALKAALVGTAQYQSKDVVDLGAEYVRLGLLRQEDLVHPDAVLPSAEAKQRPCRLTTINRTFALCASYPELLVVPRVMPDKELAEAASFRSRKRFPVIVWQRDGAVMARSSQPASGIRGQRSVHDEKLIEVLRKLAPNPDKLLIIDARPKLNARGNQLKGKGFETTEHYAHCQILFMDIQNIHAVRNSYFALQTLLEHDPYSPVKHWLSRLDQTKWLAHLGSILHAAVRVAEALSKDKRSVLVHCSDGWDRTAQLTALAQLLLDPFYRTLDGFRVLLQKEWIAFGHKFADRCANVGVAGVTSQTAKKPDFSPVFLQFLDAVHQLLLQEPHAFEFNERFVLAIAFHLHSGRFGTFWGNNEQERKELRVTDHTLSLWDWLNAARPAFVNPFYAAQCYTRPLRPRYTPQDLRLWTGYFARLARHAAGFVNAEASPNWQPAAVPVEEKAGAASRPRSQTTAGRGEGLLREQRVQSLRVPQGQSGREFPLCSGDAALLKGLGRGHLALTRVHMPLVEMVVALLHKKVEKLECALQERKEEAEEEENTHEKLEVPETRQERTNSQLKRMLNSLKDMRSHRMHRSTPSDGSATLLRAVRSDGEMLALTVNKLALPPLMGEAASPRSMTPVESVTPVGSPRPDLG